jgi:hypothetical protein
LVSIITITVAAIPIIPIIAFPILFCF